MLTYIKYNDDKFAVTGDKTLYHSEINKIGGRWNSRMKGGAGWLVPYSKENELKKLIRKIKRENKLKESNKVQSEEQDDMLEKVINMIDNEAPEDNEPELVIEKSDINYEDTRLMGNFEVDNEQSEEEQSEEEPYQDQPEEATTQDQPEEATTQEQSEEATTQEQSEEEPYQEQSEEEPYQEQPDEESIHEQPTQEQPEDKSVSSEDNDNSQIADDDSNTDNSMLLNSNNIEQRLAELKSEPNDFDKETEHQKMFETYKSEKNEYESDDESRDSRSRSPESYTNSEDLNNYDSKSESDDDTVINNIKDAQDAIEFADIDSDDDSVVIEDFLNNLLGDLSDEEERTKKLKKSKERFRRITKSRDLDRKKKKEKEEKIKFKKQLLESESGRKNISGPIPTFEFYQNLALRNNIQGVAVSDTSDSEYSDGTDDYPSVSTVKKKSRAEEISDLETEITQLRLENEKLSTQLKSLMQKY